MALVTIPNYFFTLGGLVRVNLTYDDATNDVRAVQVWNEAAEPMTWRITDSRNRTDEYTVPAGTVGQVVNVQRNRFTYTINADGDRVEEFSVQFVGPAR